MLKIKFGIGVSLYIADYDEKFPLARNAPPRMGFIDAWKLLHPYAGNLYVADFYFNTIRVGYPPPLFRNPSFNVGQFVSVLTGPPGQLEVVEVSSEQLTWLPIWTNTFAGPVNFIDPQSGVTSKRFYRTRLP